MKLFTCDDHDTHWPVGGASVVIAENAEIARELLRGALAAQGLNPAYPFTLVEVDLSTPQAIVLRVRSAFDDLVEGAIAQGWLCPRCRRINAPHRDQCDCSEE